MSGWAGSRKAGRSVEPVRQPVQSGTHDWRHVAGFITFSTEYHHEHNNYTRKLAANHLAKPQSHHHRITGAMLWGTRKANPAELCQ